MAMTSDAPADTTMMRIVHDAYRRDLVRATAALGSANAGPEQRRAIGTHLAWMMRSLHDHHASEDRGLYPLVRERAAGAADVIDVLDRMAREHDTIAAAMSSVDAASTALVEQASDAAARATVAALDSLREVLLPHLQEEEHEAMPLVSRLITRAEWQAIEKEHNLDPKSTSDLAFEGHWLIDEATAADRIRVIELVPPIERFVLLHAYARRYRRHAAACWGDGRRRPHRVQSENDVSVTVDADIDELWDVVRDVTRVGEWSHECTGAAWLAGSTSPIPGARFRGRNRAGLFRWGRVCEIVSAEPHELVWITVPTALFPDSSEWRITLDEVADGTRISQQFRVIRAPKVLSVLYALMIPAHRDRTAALVEDLERLGAVARRSHTPA